MMPTVPGTFFWLFPPLRAVYTFAAVATWGAIAPTIELFPTAATAELNRDPDTVGPVWV